MNELPHQGGHGHCDQDIRDGAAGKPQVNEHRMGVVVQTGDVFGIGIMDLVLLDEREYPTPHSAGELGHCNLRSEGS